MFGERNILRLVMQFKTGNLYDFFTYANIH